MPPFLLFLVIYFILGNFTLEDEGFTIDLRDPLDYKTKEGIEL